MTIATRAGSRFAASRRGEPALVSPTSAWISTSKRARADDARDDARAARARAAFAGGTEEQRRRIVDLMQSALVHAEDAQFLRVAEAVLVRAQDAQLAAAVALEVQHGVDDVLEQPRSGDRPVLGHVADHEDRAAGALGELEQRRGALAHLRDAAGVRIRVGARQRLDRVDDDDARAEFLESGEDPVEVGLREQQRLVAGTQPLRAQFGLRGRFLAGNVQHARPGRRERARDLEHERRLAGSRRSADQHEAAGNDPAAEQRVELGVTRRDARHRRGRDVAEARRARCVRGRQAARRAAGAPPRRRGLRERVPRLAGRTASEPARGLVPARRTEEDSLAPCHRRSF